MARFITVPPAVALLNPITDEPTGEEWAFSRYIRFLFADGRLTQARDVFSLMDLRMRLCAAKPGDVVRVDEDDHGPLSAIAKQPTTVPAQALYPSVPFARAIVDASTTEPKA